MKGISFFLLLGAMSCASHQEGKDPIKKVLNSGYERYRQCYLESDSYHGRSATPKGSLKVKLFVNADGSVKTADIQESDFKDANFHACLKSYLKMLNFGQHPQGHTMEVIQPLNFLPGAP